MYVHHMNTVLQTIVIELTVSDIRFHDGVTVLYCTVRLSHETVGLESIHAQPVPRYANEQSTSHEALTGIQYYVSVVFAMSGITYKINNCCIKLYSCDQPVRL